MREVREDPTDLRHDLRVRCAMHVDREIVLHQSLRLHGKYRSEIQSLDIGQPAVQVGFLFGNHRESLVEIRDEFFF